MAKEFRRTTFREDGATVMHTAARRWVGMALGLGVLLGIGRSAQAAEDDALTISRVDTTGLGAGSPAMATGKDGLPILSYVRNAGAAGVALRVVHCQDRTCTRLREGFRCQRPRRI